MHHSNPELSSGGHQHGRRKQAWLSCQMFVCLGWKVSLLDEGIEGFLEPNPLIDGLSWVGQRLLKGGVCGWRLPSAVCLIDPRSAVVRGVLQACIRTPSTVLWLCVCVCVYEGSSLSVHCLCVRMTLPQWSGSLLPLHVFLPLRCSLLWKFSENWNNWKAELLSADRHPHRLLCLALIAHVSIFMIPDFCRAARETILLNWLYVATMIWSVPDRCPFVCPCLGPEPPLSVWPFFFFVVTLGCCSLSRETTVCHSHRNRALFTSP